MVSEFYIKLLSKDLGNLYDEKVVGATLYRIHWDVDVPLKSKYFLNFQANKVDDFKNKVPKTTAPYILVVQTKSEYNTDYADLTFTKPYFDKKTKDFKLIQNEDKKAAESDFLEVFSAVLDLRKQIDLFQSSLQTKYTDWIAYARLIDSYHHIGLLKKHAISSLASKDVRLKEKYGKLYTNVQTEIDLWFNAEMLLKFREIGRFLIALDSDSVSLTKSSAQLYKDIELLDFYRERLSQSEIQGRLPKEIESLSSFQKVNEWRNELENVFFKKEFQYSAELTGKDMNLVWLEKCKNQFPLCKSCPNQVSKLTQEFEKTTVNLLNKQFSAISNSLYHTLGCLDASIQFLDKYIDSGRETNQIPPLVIDNLAKDKDELARLVQTYQFIISKDPQHLSLVELQQLMTDFNTRKSKTLIIWDRLRGDIIPSDLKGCSGGLF